MSFLPRSLLAALILGLAPPSHAAVQDAPAPVVGFRMASVPDPSGAPVEVGVWYPARGIAEPRRLESFVEQVASDAPVAGDRLPLVVISHGNGGSFTSHLDTAMALARAGFVVAALTHTGDNYRDQSRATDMANRPRQLALLIDYMLAAWPEHAHIDPARIGAFGFSSGGFTVLALAGGEPDLGAMIGHCRAHPANYDCLLLAKVPPTVHAAPVWIHDRRVKAVAAAAPALGFAFGPEGLKGISAPVQLWRAADDHVLPDPDYATAVRRDLPAPPEYHVVEGADHYDFLAPCSAILEASAPAICRSGPNFDRAGFHAAFNQAVAAFFRAQLGKRD